MIEVSAVNVGGSREPFVMVVGFDPHGRGPYEMWIAADDAAKIAEDILRAARAAKEGR